MFSIDQENAGKFIIDSRTGWLSLRDKVDREERDSYIINITITDLGVPARSGSCQVSVNVTDINDSPPVFVQVCVLLLFYISFEKIKFLCQ